MPDKYAVLGNPIAHSKSPLIHRDFALQTGQDLIYTAMLAPLDKFRETARGFIASGGRGFNVTVPFKEEAWRLVDERSAPAELAGALNTVTVRDDGSLFGDNTDGVGLVRDLVENNRVDLGGARILLLGAGGAARGVVGPLLSRQPQRLVIANRTASRAIELAQLCAHLGTVEGSGFSSLRDEQFDVIINATSAGLADAVPAVPLTCLRHRGCCYDMVYSDAATPFQKWARAAGADIALDGLGMLVEQAAEAFELWRGVRPDASRTIADLR